LPGTVCEAAHRTTATTDFARQVIATLRAHEPELRHAGICRLSLFGSVARGDSEAESDVDLAVEFDPDAEMDLIRLVALERRIGETLGRPVEILPEPIESPRLRANVERDRRIAFQERLAFTTSLRMPSVSHGISPTWIARLALNHGRRHSARSKRLSPKQMDAISRGRARLPVSLSPKSRVHGAAETAGFDFRLWGATLRR
jgi:uncharacterized protein